VDNVTITTRPNGPYLVKGPITLVDPEGKEFKVDRDPVALCRCGASTTKPFCDGTHSRIGFQAAEKAVREADKSR
jgi:CDGSH-type Zn-finger protein